jgi:hypothetical protein
VQKIVITLVCFCCFYSLNVTGQEPADSVEIYVRPETDTLHFDAEPSITDYPIDSLNKHLPARAAMMSAVFPGLGQIYNKKYWKVPVVYAAVGVSVGIFLRWQNSYNRYRRAYIDLMDNDPNTNYFEILLPSGSYDYERRSQAITKGKEQLRTWRDWSIVAMVAAYALNIIDANVDAHLIDFNLDDNISFNIQPCFLENDFYSKKIGLTLQLTF